MTSDLTSIEFHRSGCGMLPARPEADPGTAICFPRDPQGNVFTGFCSCRAGRKTESCPHFSRLVKLAAEIRKGHGGRKIRRQTACTESVRGGLFRYSC